MGGLLKPLYKEVLITMLIIMNLKPLNHPIASLVGLGFYSFSNPP
jgi:hypothetical protein